MPKGEITSKKRGGDNVPEISEELREIVEKLPDEQLINIGASSGFIYCGTGEEFAKIRDGLNADLNERYIKSALETRKTMEKLADRMTGELTDNLNAAVNQFKVAVTSVEESIKRMNSLVKKDDKREPLVPLDERKVKETYKRLDGTGINILIDGDEEGAFWDIGEYRRWKQNQKLEVLAMNCYTALLYIKDHRSEEDINLALKMAGMEAE